MRKGPLRINANSVLDEANCTRHTRLLLTRTIAGLVHRALAGLMRTNASLLANRSIHHGMRKLLNAPMKNSTTNPSHQLHA